MTFKVCFIDSGDSGLTDNKYGWTRKMEQKNVDSAVI